MDTREVQQYLIKHNIRPSMQRIAIMQHLMENKNHPTIDDIYNALLPYIPTLSKTTIYNTLKLFYENNAVLWITIDDKNVRFDGDTTCHAHFKCRHCGRIYDIELDMNEMPSFKGNPQLIHDEIQIYFLGLCQKCKEEISKK